MNKKKLTLGKAFVFAFVTSATLFSCNSKKDSLNPQPLEAQEEKGIKVGNETNAPDINIDDIDIDYQDNMYSIIPDSLSPWPDGWPLAPDSLVIEPESHGIEPKPDFPDYSTDLVPGQDEPTIPEPEYHPEPDFPNLDPKDLEPDSIVPQPIFPVHPRPQLGPKDDPKPKGGLEDGIY